MLDLLQVNEKEVPDEEISVDDGVSSQGEGAMHAVHNKVCKLVSSAHSETLGVDPDHRQLVEQHLEVDEGVHRNFSEDEQRGRGQEHRSVSEQQQVLIQSLRIIAGHHSRPNEEQDQIHWRRARNQDAVVLVCLGDRADLQSLKHLVYVLILLQLLEKNRDDRDK